MFQYFSRFFLYQIVEENTLNYEYSKEKPNLSEIIRTGGIREMTICHLFYIYMYLSTII